MCRNPTYLANFNAYRNSAVPVFRLYNHELEEEDSSTYLGILFDKHINLHHAATHALRPFIAALRRVKEFGIEKRNSDRPHCGFSRHMRCQLACMCHAKSMAWTNRVISPGFKM